ncbi:YgiQ family radical SAM protein [Christensenella tenuis]|uniref:YgiQ family radical SAM protein n=1 Tax=Christensenella tenuis TaxID=2763033 RepID=A0ABR7EBB0_9FIRM|nr:YgiQ family radical SAM protein [Christensenella tenuis]MBC5647045.1 YgiQ family radical SAM protein [Christensenella tenuis]
MNGFLPISKADMAERGIAQLDFVLITGDAYVDHPSFAHAIISRYLVAHGYSVGIIAQPSWKTADDFKRLGRPRLGFLISAGNMDSMVNLYSVTKHRRAKDLYSPGGKTGKRPARSTIIYTKKIREAYGDVPVIIGGIEASLRRFAHYDYWDDVVKPSILAESGADLLVYGMGERPIIEIAEALDGGLAVRDITYIEGTVYFTPTLERVYEYKKLPAFREVRADKKTYAKAFMTEMHERGQALVQEHKDGFVVQNIPARALSQKELDFVYAMPFMRTAHPMYEKPIPALEEVKFSITATRGCIGACAFCALYYHQGKDVAWRSIGSIVGEAEEMTKDAEFKGYIHDVGGPTANFYGVKCTNPKGRCTKRRCLTPEKCRFLKENHAEYIRLLRKVRTVNGVKKVFIRSGIRYDYALLNQSGDFIRELAAHHVSGQLKLAPEHVSADVLKLMGKPGIEKYQRFCQKFNAASQRVKKKQYVLPYFMSSHPGCTLTDAVRLAEFIRDTGFMPEQAQDFYPTPGTLATCMYYTGLDPETGRKVYIPRSAEEKAMQRALIQYKNPKNRGIVKKALLKAERDDLIGQGKKKLIRG